LLLSYGKEPVMKVLVVYATRHGGTRGIAERIGEVLQADGFDAQVSSATQLGPSR